MVIELRPKKDLLDSNFNGYKLSLDPIPAYRQNINEGVDHVDQSEDQYSFTHTKVFSLHNHLFSDAWHDNTVFFVDKAWKVHKAAVSADTGRVDQLEVVWTVPHQIQRSPGHYNISMIFPSSDTTMLADGCGHLHLLTHANNTQWQVELSEEVEPGLLMAARFSAECTLHCVLMTLETITAEARHHASLTSVPTLSNKPRPATINTVLHWLTLTKGSGGVWSVTCTRRLEGAGSVDYVALEVSCAALYVVSNTTFKFTADSANPLPPPQEDVMEVEEQKLVYTWEQTEDDLKVVVAVGEEVTRDDVDVVVKEKELMIQCQQQTLVRGALYHGVDMDLTTWTLQPGQIEVSLSKQEVGLIWPELVPGDTKGQQLVDSTIVEQVHSRLRHLCSDTQVKECGEGLAPTFNLDQLEECDTAPDDTRTLARLDATTHSVSHLVSLAGHQWLMSIAQDPVSVPCVCVRHDVDGCIWRLDPPPLSSATDWPCQHIGTFCALGYVAASKQQKKFILAAPDLAYAVICEASSHVFMYRKASLVNGELRNRKTSAQVPTVAKQQLINLESPSAVLGAHTSSSHLFVLTSDTLYTFHTQ